MEYHKAHGRQKAGSWGAPHRDLRTDANQATRMLLKREAREARSQRSDVMNTKWLTNIGETEVAEYERELTEQGLNVFVTMPRATEFHTSQELFKMGMVAVYQVLPEKE